MKKSIVHPFNYHLQYGDLQFRNGKETEEEKSLREALEDHPIG